MLNYLESKNKFVYALLIIYWAVLLFFTSLPGKEVPKVGLSDKIEHFLAFAGLFILLDLSLAVQKRFTKIRKFHLFFALLFSSIYGGLDELHQHFIPDRSCDILDWTADSLGALIGLIVMSIFHYLNTRLFKKHA